MFCDTHCHLDFEQFNKDRQKVVEKAIEEKVEFIINPGIDLESSTKACKLANQFYCVYACCGIHPHNAASSNEEELQQCMKLINGEKILGIGETGLDFYYQYSDRDTQIKMFKSHIEFARKFDLPLIVHQRNAEEEMIEIFQQIKYPSKVVFHCFSGSKKLYSLIMEKGFYISFAGILTFKNAEILRKIAGIVPPDRIFFETDSPYLAPSPFRGKRNEPRFVRLIVEEFSRIRKMSVEEVASISTENAKNFFGIK